MTVRNIKKNLAGAEDLLHGIGIESQSRGGAIYDMHKLDTYVPTYDVEEMKRSSLTFMRMYWTDTSYTDFRRNPTGTVGIPSDLGGVWEVAGDSLKLRQLLAKQAAEAGFNLVNGSFEEGAITSGWPDVVWCQTNGKYYQWHLDEAKTVTAGSTPTNVGNDWVDRTDDYLRFELTSNGTSIDELSKIKIDGQGFLKYDPLSSSSSFDPSSIYFRFKREWGIKDWGMNGSVSGPDDYQKAVNMLNDVGVIKLRQGQFMRLQAPLSLAQGQNIIGDSRSMCNIIKDHTGNLLSTVGYSKLHGFSVSHPYQTLTGTPVENSGAVVINNGGYNEITDVNLGNCWVGIDSSAGCIGGTIKDVIGLPYYRGIIVDAGYDVIHWSDIHFNPNIFGLNGTNNAAVLNFIYNNAEAFTLLRQDWGKLSGLFAYGYKIFMHMDASVAASGSANNIEMLGCHGDGLQQFIYAPNNQGFDVIGGHYTTFNPWGTDPSVYTAANVFGGSSNITVAGLRSGRSSGFAFDIQCPTHMFGVELNDVMKGITNSSYVGEAFQFSGNAAGSEISATKATIASNILGTSRGALISCDDVRFSNFITSNTITRIQTSGDYRYYDDSVAICSTAKRPTAHLGQMVFDTTLGEPIWATIAGWKNAMGALV